ncbi:MAG: prenyltransferase [Flavobacteriales bacterium]|nr:prenyltransferase [Flavobacteriales bacterium]
MSKEPIYSSLSASQEKSKSKLGLQDVILISRPRFWMYVLGTFLVGMIAGGNPFLFSSTTVFTLLILALLFTFPANLFIYGVNDIYDYDTDVHNVKKEDYEGIVHPYQHKRLSLIIAISLIPFIPFILEWNAHLLWALAVFFFTGYFYSALPLRAKVRPPLDILFSSIIYTSPALVGYFATGHTSVEWFAVIGGLLWSFGMQTYSAVPDIEADRKACINTLATVLGQNRSLVFCLLAYMAAGIIGFFYIGPFSLLLGGVYSTIVILSIFRESEIFKFYKYFPLINVFTGAALFFYIFFETIL